MKKYIVKTVSSATERNINNIGSVQTWYKGKNDKTLGCYGIGLGSFELNSYLVSVYGYDRICDAKRNYSFKNPQNDDCWQSTVEIIEMTV